MQRSARSFFAGLTALMLLPPFEASAEAEGQVPSTAEEASDGGLFEMRQATGDYLKIDRRNGRVSFCRQTSGNWRCTLIDDDRNAYEAEIAALKKEIARLREKIAKMEAEGARPGFSLGPEEEKKFDEFMDFSEEAFRRFFGMVQTLKRNLEEEEMKQ